MRHRRLLLLAASVAPVAAAACSGSGASGEASRVTVTDSAGIEIVVSPGPRWEEGSGWRVDTLPVVDLARGEGDPDHEFSFVRDLLRLPDGRIAVAEGTRIRLYDAGSGDLLWSFGREGEGPGEFQRLTDLGLRGDSLVAWDYWQRRVTVLTPEGELARVFRADFGTAGVELHDLGDGTLVVEQRFPSVLVEDGPWGRVRIPVPLVRATWEGELVDTLGQVPGVESVRVQMENGVSDRQPMFGRRTFVAAHGGELVIADATGFGYQRRARDFTLRRIVRAPRDLTLTDPLWQAEMEARLGRSDTPRMRQAIAESPRPEERPAYIGMVVDHQGAVWLREGRGEYLDRLAPDPRRWDVFSPQDQWLGAVHLPPFFEVHEIGEDWILGIRRDEFEVEHPTLLRLHRSPLAGAAPEG